MKKVATRRKCAIPDDDSSFLLCAQPAHLNVVGVHRDREAITLVIKSMPFTLTNLMLIRRRMNFMEPD
jgi:hypothetical protein